MQKLFLLLLERHSPVCNSKYGKSKRAIAFSGLSEISYPICDEHRAGNDCYFILINNSQVASNLNFYIFNKSPIRYQTHLPLGGSPGIAEPYFDSHTHRERKIEKDGRCIGT